MRPADTKQMLFADTAALGLPGLILLAVVVAAFIAWLIVGTRNPDVGDLLGWIVAGLCGVATIAYAGSWHEVTVDPGSKRVTERFGYLGYGLDWLGQQRGFEEFTTVLVERTASVVQGAATTPGSQGAQTAVKSSREHSYSLSLRGPDRQIKLPMATTDDMFFHLRARPRSQGVVLPPMEARNDVLALEAAARQLAGLSSAWAAKRRGYALRSVPADRPDPRSDPQPRDAGAAPGWFLNLPFMPKGKAAESPRSPVLIEVIAADVESPIEGK